MKQFIYAALVAAALILPGCVTPPVPTDPAALRQAQIERLVHLAGNAAQLGTEAFLLYYPEKRQYFQDTLGVLKELQATKNFDPVAFAAALSNLPVKELKSPEAVLIIDFSAMLFDEVMSSTTTIEQPEIVQKVLAAVIIGMERGMPLPPPANRLVPPASLDKPVVEE